MKETYRSRAYTDRPAYTVSGSVGKEADMYRQRYEIHIPSDEITVTINKPRLITALIKAARIALGIIITVSMLAMLGTAGALDNDAIEVGQAVTRCLIGLAVLAGAVGGIRLTEVLE